MDISEYYDEISQCNKCGFCQVACPIFRSTGHESGVARGRLALLRALIEGRLDWDKELEEPLYDCLGCGACTSNCFPAVPTSDLVVKARSEYLEKVDRKPVHQMLFDYLLPYPRRLHLAARAVALGKNTGISRMARALGLLRIFGRDFSRAEDIIEKLPPLPFRDRFKPGVYEGTGESLRVGYFVGCGVDVIQQEAGEATLQLLKKVAKSVTLLNNCCCGLPAQSYGDLDAAKKLAGKNLDILASDEFDAIVTDCSSCASFLKKYPEIFADDDRRGQAEKAASRFKDMVELILTNKPVSVSPENPVVATYHDPCHASRGQGISSEPREILKSVKGLEYREMPEADWCCGGAGSYALSHYDLSQRVLDRKMENLKSTGADMLVTSCPACMIQLSYGIRRHELKTKVCHISQVVAGMGR
ncbi:MAG: (Fe-S)-binding protein [Desulfobacterales bacterium]|nr:(Fe-S)-binding protein [Desulfobacterales bacterium]